jgi:hypothetical protein
MGTAHQNTQIVTGNAERHSTLEDIGPGGAEMRLDLRFTNAVTTEAQRQVGMGVKAKNGEKREGWMQDACQIP